MPVTKPARLHVQHERALSTIGAAIGRLPSATLLVVADFDEINEAVEIRDPAAPVKGPAATKARTVRVVQAVFSLTTYDQPDYEDDVEVAISYFPLTKAGKVDSRVRQPRTYSWLAKGDDPEQFRAIIDAIGAKLDGVDLGADERAARVLAGRPDAQPVGG